MEIIETYKLTNNKLAIFDLDHTLIKPIHGVFPKDKNDWKLIYEIDKLKNLKDYDIIIITNQSEFNKKAFLLDRIKDFVEYLKKEDIKVNVYISTENDIYRKPNTGIFEKIYNNQTDIFYVGDAAGRPNDFSDSDLKFAYNICTYLKIYKINAKSKFYTPEEFFLNKKEKLFYSGFNPIEYLKNYKKSESSFAQRIDIPSFSNQTLYIMIGPPASGKSTLTFKLKKRIVSQDECGSKIKTIKKFKQELQSNDDIILDNTNSNKEIREEYINIAREYNDNINIIYLLMNVDKLLCLHLNVYRARLKKSKILPNVVYNVFYKKYQEPDEEEKNKLNIKEIIKIPFIPEFNTKEKLLYFLQKS